MKLNQSLEENKEKINIINSKKTLKSCNYNDEDLFILWAYYMQKMNISPYLSCFDLVRYEYGHIIYKIFGKESCKFFFKDTENEKDKWNKKSLRRIAFDIVMTYKRRGQEFLRDSLKPKEETDLQKKYLTSDYYGFLNNNGIKK